MYRFLLFIIFFIITSNSNSEINNYYKDNYFYVGRMVSYDDNFTLYFKTREKAILSKGENSNYINYYPQDLYLYDHKSKKDYPIISYEWFPKKVKNFSDIYNYPLFPEDFAYYLMNDNNTLVLVSAKKKFYQNLKYDIKKNKLEEYKYSGKLNFIISSYAENCGFKSLKSNLECKLYKPLISKNLIN